jgi:hypothetical protein
MVKFYNNREYKGERQVFGKNQNRIDSTFGGRYDLYGIHHVGVYGTDIKAALEEAKATGIK